MTIEYDDDDDDPDKGGQKILRKKSEIEEEDEKEGKISIPYFSKPKDDDNDDEKGMNIQRPPRKTSDDYRLEIAVLESEKDKLMEELEKYKVEIPELADINRKLVERLKEMQEEIDVIKGVDNSLEKEYQELRKIYDQQLKDIENMGYTNRELIEERKRIYNEYKEKVEEMEILHNEAKTESQREMEDIREKYDNEIKDLKEQLRNKSNEIQDLYKDNFSKDERIDSLQSELNAIKDKYNKKERELNTEIVKLNELLQQQDIQYHSTKAAEIINLNLIIQNLEGEKNGLLMEMQQKQQEIHNLKNMLTESMTVAEKDKERLVKETKDQANKERARLIKEKEDEANMKHNKLMAEKDIETRNVIQELEQNYKQQMSQYKKDVPTEALRLAGQITKEKDEEIQQLTEELNQYKYKPGESLSQLGGMIQSLGNITEGVMEEEIPKQYPGSLNLEEKKEHVMQTRSKGPVSFGEKTQQEVFDPYGNLISKGTIYDIPNLGKLNARQVVENLIKSKKGSVIVASFKNNFENYASNAGDKRNYDNKWYATKALEILQEELNNDNATIAYVMSDLIQRIPSTLADFKELYNKYYADHHDREMEERIKKLTQK